MTLAAPGEGSGLPVQGPALPGETALEQVAHDTPEEAQELIPERYRRPDGTADWGRVLADKVLHPDPLAKQAHVPFGLFLTELTTAARSGDPRRLRELVDGLARTDFLRNFGGIPLGWVVWEATSQAYVKYASPHISNALLRRVLYTSAVIAAAKTTFDLVRGRDAGELVISLGAIGLSAVAVESALRTIPWVRRFSDPKLVAGYNMRAVAFNWATVKVILVVAVVVEATIHDLLPKVHELRQAVGERGEELVTAADQGEAAFLAALSAYGDAWDAYRIDLLSDLEQAGAKLGAEMGELTRKAKLLADERESASGLTAGARERHRATLSARERALARQLEQTLTRYEEARQQQIKALFRENFRHKRLLAEVEETQDFAAGEEIEYDAFVRHVRQAHHKASSNRLQTYADEREVLELVADRLEVQGHGPDSRLRQALEARLEILTKLDENDRRLFEIGGLKPAREVPAGAPGGTSFQRALERARAAGGER